MTNSLWSDAAAVLIAGYVLVGVANEVGAARDGERSFSRGGAASGGGLSQGGGQRQAQASTSRSGTQQARQAPAAGAREDRQQHQSERQSSRQQQQSEMQGSRQQHQSQVQSNRQQAAEDYGPRGYYHGNSSWDSGDAAAGFVVGAVVGAAATSAGGAPTTVVTQAPAPAAVGPPCNVAPIPVSGVPYYKCGATWYTAGYDSTGVVYMPVPPPAGY